MKLGRIWFLFYLTLPACIIFRFLQLYFTIDAKTGFYHNYAIGYGRAFLCLILLCTLFVGLFATLSFKRPESLPKKNILTSVFSITLGVIVLAERFIFSSNYSVLPWQLLLFNMFSLLFGLYLFALAASQFFKFEISSLFSVIPTFYLVARIICDFTTISKLALISDNIILIAIYCLSMIFFLYYAKLYIGIDDDKCFKNILSFGLSSVILCFAFSIPNIAISILKSGAYPHISLMGNLFVFALGLFILSFTSHYFSKKNI